MPSPDQPRRPFVALLLAMMPVMLVAIAVRVEYQIILPSYAYSYDISAHEEFARVIGSGQNPYATTPFYLAWPPLWGFCIYVLARIGELASAEFVQVLRTFLIAVDMIVLLVAATLLCRSVPLGRSRNVVLFGIALNPIVILLTVQHGNFDSIVAIWVMSAMLGVFTKTVPIALAPLLLPGARALGNKARFVGASLLVGPSLVGLGAFYILDPAPIIERVLLYRSTPGRFGMSGILRGLELTDAAVVAERGATLLLLGLLAWGCVKAWSWKSPRESQLALLAGMILLAIPTIGPGFAPQYAYWFVPLLALTYPTGTRRWRIALVAVYAVTAITYVILYGFAWDLGQSIFFLWDSPHARWLGAALRHDAPRTWVTLPMFVSWLGLLAAGVMELRTQAVEERTSA
jgi:hypothetical protein